MMVHIIVGGGAKEKEKYSGTASPSLLTIYSDDEPDGGDSSGKEADLGKIIGTSGDVIGRYERGEMSPSIDAVKKWGQRLILLLVIYSVRATKEKR